MPSWTSNHHHMKLYLEEELHYWKDISIFYTINAYIAPKSKSSGRFVDILSKLCQQVQKSSLSLEEMIIEVSQYHISNAPLLKHSRQQSPSQKPLLQEHRTELLHPPVKRRKIENIISSHRNDLDNVDPQSMHYSWVYNNEAAMYVPKLTEFPVSKTTKQHYKLPGHYSFSNQLTFRSEEVL